MTIFLLTGSMAVAVLFRSMGSDHFRYDAVKHAVRSDYELLIQTVEGINSDKGNLLVVNIDTNIHPEIDSSVKQVSVSSDSILLNPYKRMIFNHKGNIILRSGKDRKTASVLMVLSQMGKENLYLLKE